MASFEAKLTGGHPNSLGNTLEVVAEVTADHSRFAELFNCYFSSDEIVRLRTSNAIKRLAKHDVSLLTPYIEQLLTRVSAIDQASTQWTLAELFGLLRGEMSAEQQARARGVMQRNLAAHDDWIVLINTMTTLAAWAEGDGELQKWLIPHLKRLSADRRKAVAKRAAKLLGGLSAA